jgi:hypothetical protein
MLVLIRTKFGKRTRKKKAEEDLKTAYYYRQGVLKINVTDNSNIGIYSGTYVFIKKYSKERDQFLIEDCDGQQTWTDCIVPIRPSVGEYDVYHTCFEFLVEQNYQDGQEICYRIKNGFAFLKTEHRVCCDDFVLYKNGRLNIDNIPRSFNYALGYAENELMKKYNGQDINKFEFATMNTCYNENP